ncbi:MAG: alpha/beta fold hydrolase [Crocinitomicaceae bacterium]|nr:alpha/beta fold hydrolase [Crocinitomicaceae bacterium]
MQELFFRKLGEGKPMVILHGLFGSSDNWQTVAKKIANHYEVYLVDQRNHGKSFKSDEFSYELMIEDLRNLIVSEGLQDLVLLGHSMGGKTAMGYVQKYPEGVEKLIVADIAPVKYPVHHDVILTALNEAYNANLDSRQEAEDIIKKYIEHPAIQQFLLKNLYWEEKGKLGWKINIPVLTREIVAISEWGDQIHGIDTPTLFIRGGKSDYITEQTYPIIEEKFSDVHIETLENSGHWVHAEQPEEFYNMVMQFCLFG